MFVTFKGEADDTGHAKTRAFGEQFIEGVPKELPADFNPVYLEKLKGNPMFEVTEGDPSKAPSKTVDPVKK